MNNSDLCKTCLCVKIIPINRVKNKNSPNSSFCLLIIIKLFKFFNPSSFRIIWLVKSYFFLSRNSSFAREFKRLSRTWNLILAHLHNTYYIWNLNYHAQVFIVMDVQNFSFNICIHCAINYRIVLQLISTVFI